MDRNCQEKALRSGLLNERMALERIQILKKLSGKNAPSDIAKPFGPPLITMQTLGPSVQIHSYRP